jgi:carboxyl-terminal processing protease
MRGLIFDLRGNPGGLLDVAEQIASRFIPAGPIVWTRERSQTMDTMRHDDVITEIHRQHPHYPLVVLVDGGSASASEIVSGAIKDTEAGVLIGEKTYGKGVVQSILPLQDGSAARITTQHYYTAHKNDINHKGIEPNILVKFTDDQEREHADFERDHPGAFYDLQYDPQLRRGLDQLTKQLQVASSGPSPWND